MIVHRMILAAYPLLLSCDAAPPRQEEKLPLPALPTAAQLASACYQSPGEMMAREAEEAARGVFIEPTYEEFIVRAARCEWRDRERRVAGCSFQQSSIPLGEQETPRRDTYLRSLEERDWERVFAVLTHDPVLGWERECRIQPAPPASL